MEFRVFSCNMLVIFTLLLCTSQAFRFNVGGKNGWVPNPSESYNHWAERNRFQVNDTLYFKYKKGQDSVLVVTKDDYDTCNTKNPIHSFTDGETEFKFDRSGPFFFISGVVDNCNKGEKLIVVVLAVRPGAPPTHAPPPPSPKASPPPSPTASPPPSPTPAPPKSAPPGSSPGGESQDTPAPAPKDHSAAPSISVSGTVGLGLVIVVLGSFVGLF